MWLWVYLMVHRVGDVRDSKEAATLGCQPWLCDRGEDQFSGVSPLTHTWWTSCVTFIYLSWLCVYKSNALLPGFSWDD
jgi:hypothetical protein